MQYFVFHIPLFSVILKKRIIRLRRGDYMARQEIDNNEGTDLIIDDNRYISLGKNGADIVIKNGDKMIWFDGEDAFERFVDAIDIAKASLSTG